MTASDNEPHKQAIANLKNSLRPQLPKRFYKVATASARDDGYAVLLDGRPVRTPAKKPLVVPTVALAEELAAEWAAQDASIDPATMPLTRLVNSAIDGVADRAAEVRAEIVKYAGSDLLFYRADGPQALVARQAKQWDAVVAWAERWAGGRFILGQGIMPVSQPQTTLDKIAARIAGLPTLPLAGLHAITTLTGSALLALAHANGRISAAQAWSAAHVDEDHQVELWGKDDEAEARRANRWREMQAASRLL